MLSKNLIAASGNASDPEGYWFNTFHTNGGSDIFVHGLETDSNGDIYVLGVERTGGDNPPFATKINKMGEHEWAHKLNSGNSARYQFSVTDSSGDTYITGRRYQNPNEKVVLSKVSPDGAILWDKVISAGGSNTDLASGIAFNSNGNILVSCDFNFTSGSDSFIEVSPSGGFVSRKTANTTLGSDRGLKKDSLGNYYFTASSRYCKANSEFNGVFRLIFDDSLMEFDVDANGNSSVFCQEVEYDGQLIYLHNIVRLNSSGVKQWAKRIRIGIAEANVTSVACDSQGNTFVSRSEGYIFKLDSNGNGVAGIRISHTSNQNEITHIKTDKDDNLIVVADERYVARLPNDLNVYGTYGNYTISVQSYSLRNAGTDVSTSSVINLNNQGSATVTNSGLSKVDIAMPELINEIEV